MIMKVLFLIRAKNHPASRYRALQYFPYLEKQGINAQSRFFPESYFDWRRLVKEIKDIDIVFIQKKMISVSWLQRIKKTGAKIVYDIDDAIMFNSPRHPSPRSPRRLKRYRQTVQMCDLVIAGNSYLRSLTEKYNPRVQILPLSIDLKKYPLKDYNIETQSIVLGWIGGTKSLFFVKKLMPVLEKLAQKHPGLALKIVCNEFPSSDKIKIIKKQWQEAEEGEDITGFDIGFSVLTDDPWSRGKCGTKLLQYMAAGVVSVASPVGVHKEIVQDGVNGFLAANNEEWITKVSALIKDKSLRQTIGLAGRRTVAKYHSLEKNALKMIDIFRSVLKIN